MALAKTLRDGFPSARLAFVVAMASDKDQHSFARALLAGNFLNHEHPVDIQLLPVRMVLFIDVNPL